MHADINKIDSFARKDKRQNHFTTNQYLHNYIKASASQINIPGIFNSSRQSGQITCYDTSGKFFIQNDSFALFIHHICKTKDGNLLLAVESANNFTANIDEGALIRCDEKGNILWAKLYDSINHTNYSYLYYYNVSELADGSILLIGGTLNNVSGNQDLIITKTDNNGNIIWSKTYKSKLWTNGSGSADYYYVQQMKQDAYTGDIYITGPHWQDGRNVTKIDQTNGKVIWSHYYEVPFLRGFELVFGLDIRQNDLVSFGTASYYNSYLNIYKLDKTTGDIISTTFLDFPDSSWALKGFVTGTNIQILQNGHYVLSGQSFGYDNYLYYGTPAYQGSVVELDNNFNFVNAYCLRSNLINTSGAQIYIFPDNTGLFTLLQAYSGYTADEDYVEFKKGLITKERIKHYANAGIPLEASPIKASNGSDLIVKLLGDSLTNISPIEFLELHNSDSSSDCLGINQNLTFTESYYLQPANQRVDSVGDKDFFESTNKTITARPLSNFQYFPGCQQTSFCDTLQLVASIDTLCENVPLNIVVRKNKECGAIPFWTYDSSTVSSFTHFNDSTVKVIFNKSWQGYIRASINGCKQLQDSVKITVLQAPENLYLGPDTSICPGNTILLKAKSGYASYKWQDGSADSVFTVRKPGNYFVKTTDACGGIFNDTVIVVPHTAATFSLGNDTSVCKNNFITLTAPEGFMHYQWFANNVPFDTVQSINVSPTVNTSYKVIVEESAGCFAGDSVNVSVKIVPAIHLGDDTSLCINESIVLDAGKGFNTYKWNTGASSPQIIVSQQGLYSIQASLNGCFAYDTLQVLQVKPLPSFTLGNDTALCEGQQLQYSFNLSNATYYWSTGNTQGAQIIQNPGTYWLQVTQQGCSNGDTITVMYSSSPVIHLGNDTALCENQTLQLNAFNNNATYYWQDGSTKADYTVINAGTYYVVAYLNHCKASDTINISYKKLPFFSLGKDILLCTGQQIVLQPLLNTDANLLWQDGSTASSYTVTKEGTYILIATNKCGSFTDTVNIAIGFCNIMMPNTFSPNRDGLNDVFKVKYPFSANFFSMVVYNRWGQKIFNSDNINTGWDGTYKGEDVQQGVYIWTITYTDIYNKPQKLQGIVTLLR